MSETLPQRASRSAYEKGSVPKNTAKNPKASSVSVNVSDEEGSEGDTNESLNSATNSSPQRTPETVSDKGYTTYKGDRTLCDILIEGYETCDTHDL